MQRVNHHHLYIFWVFGRTESFSKTAEELRIAQSAVTLQIKSLEEALGLRLIDRTHPRRPKLSADGRKVLSYAEKIFESSRELLTWAQKGASSEHQTLRIGAISGLSRNLQYEFISPLLLRKDLKLEIITGDQKNLISALQNHDLDVVLTSHNVSRESGKELYAHVLTSSPVVFVRNSPIKDKKRASLKSILLGQILYSPGFTFEAKPELDAFLEGLNTAFTWAGEVDDVALLRIIALRSGAIVAIPEMGVLTDLMSKSLYVIGEAPNIQQRFYAITRHKLNPNHEVQALIQQLRKRS